MTVRPAGLPTVLSAAVLLASAGASAKDAPLPPTFNADVAPIVHRSCSGCHRPGESGPFDLLTYRDVRRRARQIARVVGSRYMPPWLPAHGWVDFEGERRLAEDEIDTIGRWVEAGTPEGDPSRTPPPPSFTEGWQLGTPDAVVEMPRTFELSAAGPDIYRNFVLPVHVDGERWIEAVEFRPGNPKIVHHARMFVDRTPASRRLEAGDPRPGFAGMDPGNARSPDGVLLGWTPGRLPQRPEPGIAWRVDGTTDLVLQLHLVPSGRPEPIRARVGLYFADGPPTRHPFALLLGSRLIDLPPGAGDTQVEDAFTLPVSVHALGVYPHAHYLAKTMHVWGELPDGQRRWLLRIDDWNFDWQDEYRYRQPISLPAGTRVVMRYTYDNSSANPRNPFDPPRRVRYGAETTDEMAELLLQVEAADEGDRPTLEAAYERFKVDKAIHFREAMIVEEPGNPEHRAALGSSWLTLGRADLAVEPLRAAVALRPDDAAYRNNLGFALIRAGRAGEAVADLRRAVELAPEFAEAHFNLAEALMTGGDRDGAIAELRRVVALRPDAAAARQALRDLGAD